MDLIFNHFSKIFNSFSHKLYMVGGTSRDYLLNYKITDYDFVTDATPDEILKFLDCDTSFKKYGVLKLNYEGYKIDIVTFRKESNYEDYRHPNKIEFSNNIYDDYLRRDFTINAIYIDENYNIIDPTNGLNDLREERLKFIGDTLTRIKEDPLRILRAKRFMSVYNLKMNDEDIKILNDNLNLIKKLNIEKVNEELRKINVIKEKNNE
ncbi:MAG: hypothetical protein ACTTID_00720 [Bacillales bacterium]